MAKVKCRENNKSIFANYKRSKPKVNLYVINFLKFLQNWLTIKVHFIDICSLITIIKIVI